MLPVILTHLVKSSHSESHSGVVKLPSKGFLGDFFSRNHGFMATSASRGPGASRGHGPGLQGSVERRQRAAGVRLSSAGLGSALGFGFS